jgi:hypothetical protein
MIFILNGQGQGGAFEEKRVDQEDPGAKEGAPQDAIQT